MTVDPARHGERQPVGDECQHLIQTQPHRLEPVRPAILTNVRRRPTARPQQGTMSQPPPGPTLSR
jgi:hypothetical protein